MITIITAKATTHMHCVHQKTTKMPWEQNDMTAPVQGEKIKNKNKLFFPLACGCEQGGKINFPLV